ncbi:MAG: hypothetical protein EPO68_09300 [Planctomycetota bacterium]|nr:MAG: hypothetical protein EPO68_09300 [Planctomycetota bacterium]
MRCNNRSIVRPLSILGTLTAGALLSVAALAASCGGGGGGGSSSGGMGGGGGALDILIGDAPADELLAFRATVDSLRLVRADGVLSSDVVLQPVELELLGLTTSHKWLTSLGIAPGTYTGAVLGFLPGSYVAVAQNGAHVAVNAVSHTATLEFGTPLVVTGGSYERAAIDVDLGVSLSGSVLAPPIAFEPRADLDHGPSGGEPTIDGLVGLTKGFSKHNKTINVQGYTDDAMQTWLGLVHVQLSPTTLLIGIDGAPFATPDAFYDELIHNKTLLDIRGTLDAKSYVVAKRIEIESHAGGPGQSNVVKMSGLVLAKDADSFEFAIGDIKKGEAIALPVLASYGNPASIEVAYGASTKFYLGDEAPTTSASLAVGQRVDVRFASFVSEPFPASKVVIHTEDPEFGGTVTDLAGLPTSFEMRLHASSHWIPDTVASSNTDVTVNAIGASFVLKTKQDPALTSADLILGLGVEVEGELAPASTPAVPSVDASKVNVKAGRLEGVATDVDAAGGTLVANGTVVHTFGNGVSSGSVTFELEPNCVYHGDATSAASLQALFDTLPSGKVVELRVEGIGSGVAGQARAFYVRAELEDD